MHARSVNLLIFVIVGSVIFFNMLFLKPIRYGDGNEYFLMLESLRNHFSADLQQKDIDGFYHGNVNAFGEPIDPYKGYFKNENNVSYSRHFWAYSLSALPARVVLGLFNGDARKAFQITNAVLFILALGAINFISKLSEKQKMLFMLLLTFSPALWFIHWTHAEIFILSFVTLSLIMLHSQEYAIAIIFGAIASFQNQALVVFVWFILLKAIWSKHDVKSLLKYGALSLLTFLPNLFYFVHFGKFSLLSKSISVKNISMLKIFEMFFDLNIGLFPYIPVVLLFFFGITFLKMYKKRSFVYEAQIFVVLIALMVICAMINNWNSGTSGPTRYVIWMLPFIFFVVTKNMSLIFDNRLKYLFVIGMIFQLLVVVFVGPFVAKMSYVNHTPAAKLVLNNFPAMYNPSGEIFCERTMHREVPCANPTVYEQGDTCKKAFLTCAGSTELQSICAGKNIEEFCNQRDNETWFYVNY